MDAKVGSASSYGSVLRSRHSRGILLAAIAFALVPPIASWTGQSYFIDFFTRVMIFGTAAVGLDLLIGYAGLISFGHSAFIGLGAYAAGILSAEGVRDIAVSLPAAVAAASLFAVVTGLVCLRTRGAYFIMITLAFGQMAYFIAMSLASYGGDNGLSLNRRNTVFGFDILKSDTSFFYFALAFLIVVSFVCHTLLDARFGRVLRGAKENETRAVSIGFNVQRFRLTAYGIAGGIGGLSGFLLANATQFVSPAYMSWQRSAELIVMVILGGAGTLYGAILGAATYLLAEEVLSQFTENWKVIFGPLLVLLVLSGSGGLANLRFRTRRSSR